MSFATQPARILSALPLLSLLMLASCSTGYWSNHADREVYGLLREKEMTVLGEKLDFDIGTPYSPDDPKEIEAVDILAERTRKETRKIGLEDAIGLSIENGREYQTEKENLYLVGMDLTRARHDFGPRLDGGTGAALDQTWVDGGQTNRQLGVQTRAGFSKLLKSGGSLAIDAAQNIFQFYLGGNAGPTTFLAARLNQPLLRGRGAVATENLTQRERNVFYGIRSFSRFQKRNTLDVTINYYRILQEKDRVRNEYFNYRNLIAFTERASELAQDRLPRFQVDQARQDELRARNRYVLAVNSYRSQVDEFKLVIGMPVGGELFLDDKVLRELEIGGLTPLPLGEDQAINLAVANRLDLLNEIDRFEDARRRIAVAADAFKPGLDLFANLSADSPAGRDYSNFDPDVYRTRIGIDLDLPLDNLDARNDFRRAQISFERQLRDLSLALDRIQLDVRSGLRGLALARERFDIQQNALLLANQRVDAVNLLLETDRAETRDLLEARNDQLGARNALTSALIDYHLTRLEFLFDLGAFNPGQDRFWVENPELPESTRSHPQDRDAEPAGRSDDDSLISPDELFQDSAL